jgi:hypothetical protein
MLTRRTAAVLALLGVFLVGSTVTTTLAEAQKKSKAKTTVKKDTREEEAKPAVAPERPQPPAQPATSSAMLEILKKYVGEKTNLGVLKKATRDLVQFDDDNTVISLPLSTIHSLRETTEKDDNDSTVVQLEVKLIAKD